MKIIEGMKKIKDLTKKAEDIRAKIGLFCADLDYETPMYPDQRKEVDGWLQSHSDMLKEILSLRLSIAKTNLATNVDIEIGGKTVTKSIAEWIHRRRDLSQLELTAWKKLSDRGLQEGGLASTSNPQVAGREIKIRRYYDPKQRDEKVELYTSEPMVIDARLEVVNAITDLA